MRLGGPFLLGGVTGAVALAAAVGAVRAGSPSLLPSSLVQTGLASWYGPRHHGRLTSNGETFDQDGFTAAHPSLPFGSRVKVTLLATGRSVVVRVNDRFPGHRGRIIDVSRAAAREIGMMRRGTGRVRLELVERSPAGHGERAERAGHGARAGR